MNYQPALWSQCYALATSVGNTSGVLNQKADSHGASCYCVELQAALKVKCIYVKY